VVVDERLDPLAKSGEVTGGANGHGRLLCLELRRSVKWTPAAQIRQHVQFVLNKMLYETGQLSSIPATLPSGAEAAVESACARAP
jgi:hypothetical protein